MKLSKIENEKKKIERKKEREKLEIKTKFLGDLSLETQIFNLSPYCYSFCCPKLLRIQNVSYPYLWWTRTMIL